MDDIIFYGNSQAEGIQNEEPMLIDDLPTAQTLAQGLMAEEVNKLIGENRELLIDRVRIRLKDFTAGQQDAETEL